MATSNDSLKAFSTSSSRSSQDHMPPKPPTPRHKTVYKRIKSISNSLKTYILIRYLEAFLPNATGLGGRTTPLVHCPACTASQQPPVPKQPLHKRIFQGIKDRLPSMKARRMRKSEQELWDGTEKRVKALLASKKVELLARMEEEVSGYESEGEESGYEPDTEDHWHMEKNADNGWEWVKRRFETDLVAHMGLVPGMGR